MIILLENKAILQAASVGLILKHTDKKNHLTLKNIIETTLT